MDDYEFEIGQVWQGPQYTYVVKKIEDGIVHIQDLKIYLDGTMVERNYKSQDKYFMMKRFLEDYQYQLIIPCLDCQKFCRQTCQTKS